MRDKLYEPSVAALEPLESDNSFICLEDNMPLVNMKIYFKVITATTAGVIGCSILLTSLAAQTSPLLPDELVVLARQLNRSRSPVTTAMPRRRPRPGTKPTPPLACDSY